MWNLYWSCLCVFWSDNTQLVVCYQYGLIYKDPGIRTNSAFPLIIEEGRGNAKCLQILQDHASFHNISGLRTLSWRNFSEKTRVRERKLTAEQLIFSWFANSCLAWLQSDLTNRLPKEWSLWTFLARVLILY